MSDNPMLNDPEELEFFVELIEENLTAMNTAARSILARGFSAYADDAVQDACISIANNIFSIKNRLECSKRRAFCVRIVKNKCIDIIRRNSKCTQQPLDDIDFSLESNAPDPLDEVLEKESYEKLIKAIGSLDENYSTVLLYKLVDGFSDTEIAALLGITPKNVNVRTYRAKQKLKKLLSTERKDE